MHSSIISAPAGVHIVGACARDTIVTTTTSTTVGVLSIVRPGPPVEFRNLTVADAPNIGIFVGGGASVSLRGVLVEGASPMGLLAMGVGTSVTIEEVAVRDAFALPSAGSDALGVGIVGGASLDATRLVVDSNDQLGIVIGDAGTSATLDDTIVRATAAITDEFGLGILVQAGARLNASRLLIEENHWAGLHISGIGTIATIEDAVIRSTQLSAAGTAGLGLAVQQGAQLMGSRLWLDRNHDVGLLVASDGTSASLEDVVVTQTQPQESDGDYGYGVTVAIGGHLEMRRAVIADNHYIGIVATSTGTQTVLEDVLVQDTAIGPDLEWPTRGVFSTNGARLDLSRTVLRRNVGIGLHIDGEATAATVADLVVSDMNPDADGSFGVGIQVQLGAQLDGDRISVDRVFQEALAAIGSASVTVSDVSLSNVEVASCAATTCPDNAFGYGAASAAASLRMTRFAIGPVANCGVFLSGFEGFVDPAEVDLDTGVVGQSAIGACVQVDEYDLDRLTDGVAYTDNGTNLDTTTLPVPESSDAIAVIEP